MRSTSSATPSPVPPRRCGAPCAEAEVGDEQQREDPDRQSPAGHGRRSPGQGGGALPSLRHDVQPGGLRGALPRRRRDPAARAGASAAVRGWRRRRRGRRGLPAAPGARGLFTAEQVRAGRTAAGALHAADAGGLDRADRQHRRAGCAGRCAQIEAGLRRRPCGGPGDATWTAPGSSTRSWRPERSARAFAAPFDSSGSTSPRDWARRSARCWPDRATLSKRPGFQAAVRRRHAAGRHHRGGGHVRARAPRRPAGRRSRARPATRLGGSRRSGASRWTPNRVETNIVIFDVRDTGLTGDELAARTLASHGVRFSVLAPYTVRAVTHLDVPSDGINPEAVRARS